jgi:magnesium chelatase family protein
MHAAISTVAFRGIDTIPVEVQVHIANGLPAMAIVGLADNAVAESRERVRAALGSIGLALPPKRIAVNLAPADVVKEGAHFDLPIALGLLVAMGAIGPDAVANRLVLGELDCMAGQDLICPAKSGPEAAWADALSINAPPDLMSLLNHLRGGQFLAPPQPELLPPLHSPPDMRDLRGQETARRVLEIAAAGRHNLLMVGRPARRWQIDAGCPSAGPVTPAVTA